MSAPDQSTIFDAVRDVTNTITLLGWQKSPPPVSDEEIAEAREEYLLEISPSYRAFLKLVGAKPDVTPPVFGLGADATPDAHVGVQSEIDYEGPGVSRYTLITISRLDAHRSVHLFKTPRYAGEGVVVLRDSSKPCRLNVVHEEKIFETFADWLAATHLRQPRPVDRTPEEMGYVEPPPRSSSPVPLLELGRRSKTQASPLQPLRVKDVQGKLRGASDRQIKSAAKSLGVTFPQSYLSFVEQYQCACVESVAGEIFEIAGIGKNAADTLSAIDVTKRYREASPELPPQLVAVMEDGFGNAYCLDTSRMVGTECPVVIWDHEHPKGAKQKPRIVGKTFDHWLRRLMRNGFGG